MRKNLVILRDATVGKHESIASEQYTFLTIDNNIHVFMISHPVKKISLKFSVANRIIMMDGE